MKYIRSQHQEVFNDYIYIDGLKYSTKNSNGEYISTNTKSIVLFYNWFNNSKTVDNKQRPIVYHHISNNDFDIFQPSIFGKMGGGIYFTSILSDLKYHNKTNGSIIYNCYLKIENPLEIENPLSKRTVVGNDGIIAFKGKSGEEIKVYKSNQIKSVENDGSWDINDDNIYS